ncbi:MAG: peptidylprolyl isomerase [bacterium]|nr:peptidylprolyl isomerase [bacterium]
MDSEGTTAPPAEPATTEAGTAAPDDAPRVKDGDLVRVHYTGTLEDGSVFDSSRQAGREPLEFTVASGRVIKGFDDAVRGLAVGESRVQRVEPVDGYGESSPDLIIEVPIDQLPDSAVVGDQLSTDSGQTVVVLAIDTATGLAQLDANHPLAGKVMFFDVELVEIVPAS